MAKGKKMKIDKMMLLIIAILVVFVGSFAFTAYNQDAPDVETSKEVALVAGCNTAPSLSISSNNVLEKATSVTTSKQYLVNGEYFATAPSFAEGDIVQVMLNASSYIDVMTEEVKMECGANKLGVSLYDYTAPSVKIKDESVTLTDSATGGANNATAIATGGSDTYEVCFTGNDKDSTGDFIYIVELGNTQNVSIVNMYSGSTELSSVDVPDFYVDTLTSPYKKAFKVPAIIGAKEVCYDVTVVAKSAKTVSGAVYTTAYVGEPLVENDGSFTAYGIEDADGTADYEATFDSDFFVTA